MAGSTIVIFVSRPQIGSSASMSPSVAVSPVTRGRGVPPEKAGDLVPVQPGGDGSHGETANDRLKDDASRPGIQIGVGGTGECKADSDCQPEGMRDHRFRSIGAAECVATLQIHYRNVTRYQRVPAARRGNIEGASLSLPG
jgi:hypothetical protein